MSLFHIEVFHNTMQLDTVGVFQGIFYLA